MAIFVRELVRPVYACRSRESQGHDSQIARAVLPREPIPKSRGGGPARPRIVSKMCDHLPLNRQETILAPPRVGSAVNALRSFAEVGQAT